MELSFCSGTGGFSDSVALLYSLLAGSGCVGQANVRKHAKCCGYVFLFKARVKLSVEARLAAA